MNTKQLAIIHCSASSWGTEKIIDTWHKQRGFSGCGYHFVILNGRLSSKLTIKALDGAICSSRTVHATGAHCRGQNRKSIGICLVGKSKFTDAQYASLSKLLCELKAKYPSLKTAPHRTFNKNKTCPNFRLSRVLDYKW